MCDYSYVLELLRVNAAEQRPRALLCQRAEIANNTTERTLRNRAKLICDKLLDLPEPQQRQFAERAVRRLWQNPEPFWLRARRVRGVEGHPRPSTAERTRL